jgi:hypothetical protein
MAFSKAENRKVKQVLLGVDTNGREGGYKEKVNECSGNIIHSCM